MAEKTFKELFAKTKLRMDRGKMWLNYLRDFLLLAVSIQFLFQMPFFQAIFSTMFLFLAFLVLGYIDEKKGIWKNEQIYSAQKITNLKEKLFNKIKK